MVCPVLEVIVKVNGFVNYLCDFVSVLVRVECCEKSAVINEFPDEVLDVFLKTLRFMLL